MTMTTQPNSKPNTEVTRVYYTGDMANSSGWFTAHEVPNAITVQLIEEDGGEDRAFSIRKDHIGNLYQGHCNPRFVTEEAYREFYRLRGVTL